MPTHNISRFKFSPGELLEESPEEHKIEAGGREKGEKKSKGGEEGKMKLRSQFKAKRVWTSLLQMGVERRTVK